MTDATTFRVPIAAVKVNQRIINKDKIMKKYLKLALILGAATLVGVIGGTIYAVQMETKADAFNACKTHAEQNRLPEWLRCVKDFQSKIR